MGHIRKREKTYKDRKTGAVRIEVVWRARMPDPHGTGTRQIEKTFKRKADAERWLLLEEAAVEQGEHVARDAAAMRFAAVVESWRESQHDLEPKTLTSYESIVDLHLLPRFGPLAVSKISHDLVQKFINDLAKGHAASTVRNVHSVLSVVMAKAVNLGCIRVSPCMATSLPKATRQEMIVLTAAEVEHLADGITPHYRLYTLMAAHTGMRAGELVGLRRRSVNPLRGTITVQEAVKEVRGKLVYGGTKTGRKRTITIPASLRVELAEYLEANPADPDAPVFLSTTGKLITHTTFYRRHFRPAVARLVERERRRQRLLKSDEIGPVELPGLPEAKAGLRFHDLRHTTASLLIAAGAHPKAIADRLGHSSIQITMDRYGHLLPSVDEALAAALDSLRVDALAGPTADEGTGGEVVALRPRSS